MQFVDMFSLLATYWYFVIGVRRVRTFFKITPLHNDDISSKHDTHVRVRVQVTACTTTLLILRICLIFLKLLPMLLAQWSYLPVSANKK